MNQQKQKPAILWPFLILFAVVSAGAILVGILYYRNQEMHALKGARQEVSAIADLKARQILLWRHERLSDGLFLSQNKSFSGDMDEFLADPDNMQHKELILNDIKSLIDNYDYRSAVIIDRNGKVRLSTSGKDTIIGTYVKPRIKEILSERKVLLTDLHQAEDTGFVHPDLLIPFAKPYDTAGTVSCLLVLRIDPQEALYPMLQSWPLISKTSETVLFQREGNDIVFLNELKHKKNNELLTKIPLSDESLPEAMALRGISETSAAIDYRGVPVVAAMKKIPESLWYLVAKVDRQEITEQMKGQVSQVLIIVILFILASGATLGIPWWYQRIRFYREKYEAEQNHLALVRHYDYILKYANDIIFLLDKDFSIIECNDKSLETFQFKREELIGRTVRILLSDDTVRDLLKDLKVLEKAGALTFETEMLRKDSTVVPLEISARMVDIEGIKYVQAICRDITERKSVEENLKESEERFRKIFEESPFGMAMTGKDLGIIRANSAFCSMTGYSENELFDQTFRMFTHPDYIADDEISFLRLVAREIPVYHTEKQYIRKDGKIIWGSTSVSIIGNKIDEVQIFLIMVEDITSRKIAESELEKSVSLLKATLESTADGILVVATNGKIVQFNRKFKEMWRIPDEVMNLMDDEAALKYVIGQLKYPREFMDKVTSLYSNSEAITEDILEFTDGRCFERYSQPQKIGGKSVGRVWSFRDITARKKAETALILAKEKAEESDRLKTAFLHNVSHEIRTPMNAILGFSTLLGTPGISEEESHQYTDIIFQSGNQLLSIINDIVDLAGIESGQVKVTMTEFNLNGVLKIISEQFSYKEKGNNLILSLKIPPNSGEWRIITDQTKFIQILSNLINNAFKFTGKGKISFGYEKNGSYLQFFVKDTGIGIPDEFQSRIFDRFYQVDNSVSRTYTGTGLGLSICKAYVELLGGEIWLKSTPGQGSVFYFTLPEIALSEKTGNVSEI